MYRVWFEGLVDKFYKDHDKAYKVCERFIKTQDKDEIFKRINDLNIVGECDICGIAKIKFEDEFDEFAPKIGKTKYIVTFAKYESVEVEAYNEDEAENLADDILNKDAYAWEGPADEITVELAE